MVSSHDDQDDEADHGVETGDDVVHVLQVGDQEQDMSVSTVCHHSDTRSNSTLNVLFGGHVPSNIHNL